MEYRGEKVVATLSGKLCSYEKEVPDCICIIKLTEGHIFVSEDNYDGTFTDHYSYSLSEVVDVLMKQPYKTSMVSADTTNWRPFGWGIRILIDRLTGRNSIDSYNQGSKEKDQYFTIIIKNELGNHKELYFALNSYGKKEFIKEFKKLKNLDET